jgi:hypothetical protein
MKSRLLSFLAVIAIGISLGGCTMDQVVGMLQSACTWDTANQTKIDTVKKAVTAITGSPPGLDVGWDVAEQAVTAICAAVQARNAKPGAKGLVYVTVKTQKTGRPTSFRLPN